MMNEEGKHLLFFMEGYDHGMKLYRTTITILSEYDPSFKVEAEELVSAAMSGDCYLEGQGTVEIDSDTLEGEGVKEFFGCLPDEEIET